MNQLLPFPVQALPAGAPHTAAIRVVLADDHDLVRSGIGALLRTMPGVEVVAEARDGQQLIDAVERLEPDIALTDLSMPGMGGLEAIAHLHRACCSTRFVVLSMHGSADHVRQAVGAGACGYLMKNAPPFELEHAVRVVMQSGRYFSSQVAGLLLEPPGLPPCEALTPRQLQVLKLVARGRASKQIAHLLGLSAKTVDVHRARIMERLRLDSIAALTRYAIREGLVDR